MKTIERRARGSVLILVLWTLSLFAVFAVSLGVGARARASLLNRTQMLASLETIAYSGVERAKAAVIADTTPDLDTSTDAWANAPAQFLDIPVGEGRFRVGLPVPGGRGDEFRAGVVDEESKINLNKAEAAVLARLLKYAARIENDNAQELSYNIIDWRDQDSNFGHPQFGAESDYYEDLDLPYACKNAPLDTLDELLLIKGLNRQIFDKISPYVTLHGSGAVNINTASRESLLALGVAERTVDKVMAYRAGTDEKLGTEDDAAFGQAQSIVTRLDQRSPPLDGEERARITDLVLAEKLTTVSSFFSAHSSGIARNGTTLDVDAVFDRTGKVRSARFSGVKWPSKA